MNFKIDFIDTILCRLYTILDAPHQDIKNLSKMNQVSIFERMNSIIYRIKKGPITFEEIKGKLEKYAELHEFPLNYSLRTFQRDLSAIRLTFGMEIRGSKRSNTHQIVTEESISINTPLGESFDLIHSFHLTKDLEEFVFFDVQVSKGTENLYELVTAIKKFKYNATFLGDLESTGRKVKGIITESKGNFEDYEIGGSQIREIYGPLELDWV